MSRRARLNAKKRNTRILWISVIAGVAALVLVISLIVQAGSTNSLSGYNGKVIPDSLYLKITGLSDSTLSTVGAGASVSAPNSISGTPLTSDDKPEILYVGGEFCPYCAIERWSMVIAFSKFGSFSGLQYWQSSPTDVNPNTPTFTFRDATFTSQYVSFVAVEEFGTSNTDVRQSLTPQQQALVSQYDTQGSIPFIDIANRYAVNGAQSSMDISGMNWTQVASQLDNPQSQVAKNIDGAASLLISAVCKVDGGKPSSVCSQQYAVLPLSYAPAQQGAAQNPIALTLVRGEKRWAI